MYQDAYRYRRPTRSRVSGVHGLEKHHTPIHISSTERLRGKEDMQRIDLRILTDCHAMETPLENKGSANSK